VHDHLEVVRKHDDPIEQLVDDDSPFSVISLGPHTFEVELGQNLEHVLESLRHLVVLAAGPLVVFNLCPQGLDLLGERGLLCTDGPLSIEGGFTVFLPAASTVIWYLGTSVAMLRMQTIFPMGDPEPALDAHTDICRSGVRTTRPLPIAVRGSITPDRPRSCGA